MISHWHYQIIAYESVDKKKDRWLGTVQIDILSAITEVEAMKVAKNTIKRPFYRLLKAWECKQCAFQESLLESMKHKEN